MSSVADKNIAITVYTGCRDSTATQTVELKIVAGQSQLIHRHLQHCVEIDDRAQQTNSITQRL